MTTRRTAKATKPDYALSLTVLLLVILGLIMVYSATFILRLDSAYFLKRQALWVVLGFAGLLAMAQLDYRILRRLALPIMGLSVLSLLAVLLVGRGVGNAQRWFLEGSVQPSEFVKLAFVIYIAAWLASKGDKIRDVTYGLIPFSILLGAVTALIVLQPDLGTAILVVATAGAMFFIAGAEVSQLIIALLAGGPTLYAVIINSGYAQDRIWVFLNPGSDPYGAGYQIQGILSALSAGGITGCGLGAGTQKLVPPYVYHTDAILSVVGEELGLVGCLIIISLFLFIAYRGLVITLRAPDTFGMLLGFGVTCWVVFQAVIHIAVNTATLPFTGITLPFMSFGGSSLTMCLSGIGVLLSISRVGRERKLRTSAAFAFGRRDRRPRLSRTRRR